MTPPVPDGPAAPCPLTGGDHDWHGQYADGGRYLHDACRCGATQ